MACLYTSVLALTPAAMALPAPWSSRLNMLVWIRIFCAARSALSVSALLEGSSTNPLSICSPIDPKQELNRLL